MNIEDYHKGFRRQSGDYVKVKRKESLQYEMSGLVIAVGKRDSRDIVIVQFNYPQTVEEFFNEDLEAIKLSRICKMCGSIHYGTSDLCMTCNEHEIEINRLKNQLNGIIEKERTRCRKIIYQVVC